MSCKARTTTLALMIVLLLAQPAGAARLNGLLKLGAVSLDEQYGDLSAVQETYNIDDGFNFTRLLMNAQLGERDFFLVDVGERNQDAFRGLFNYRRAGLGQLRFQYDQNEWLYDADGDLETEREDWHLDATLTPAKWLRITANTNLQTREGDRLGYPLLAEANIPVGGFPHGFPAGFEPTEQTTVLGDRYDYTLYRYQAEAEVQKDGRGFALGYEGSDFSDDTFAAADRQGQIFSARLFGTIPFLPFDMSHYLRGAYGTHELSESGLEHELATFQYVGTLKPVQRVRLRYMLHMNRVDDESTDLKTDYIRNEGRLTYRHRYGSVYGGYGYVTDDNERALTSSDVWEAGASLNLRDGTRAVVRFATRDKDDEEDLTLLKDIEDTRFEARLQVPVLEQLTLGASYNDRSREFPVIGVEMEGVRIGTFARLTLTDWLAFHGDYTYSDDDYDDRVGGFESESHVVNGRAEFTAIDNLRLMAGAMYLDYGKDLDIEKSILTFEAQYDLLEDYFLEVKYNVYNYDDYILLDRYYTANVVWMNVGYRFAVE